MPRVTRAAAHLAVAEVKRRRQTAPHPLYRQRWLIIYNAQVDPRPAATIATHCGVSKAVGPQLISSYPRFGVSAVETVGQGGRYHAYRSVDQERELLAPFFARAETGELATASESKRAFEARVGHEVVECPIYRLLDRVGWRKLMPRPKHPKASPEAQEQFKKTLRGRCKRLWQGGQPQIPAPSC